jgi:hypothetical protein
MGYSYEARTGRLCCDRCGKPGGVRKRSCPYKVLGHSLNGPRHTLPYCMPLALCGGCYTAMGGQNGVHGDKCRQAAAASQAEDDAIEAALDAGESFSVAAWGDWETSVPAGQVGLKFVGRDGVKWRLVPEADYPHQRLALSAAAGSTEWEGHP